MNNKQTITGTSLHDPHEIVGRVLTATLKLGDEAAWRGFATVIAVRLGEGERAAVAFAALQAQLTDHAVWTAQAAIQGTVHVPTTSYLDTPSGKAALVAWRDQREARRRSRR